MGRTYLYECGHCGYRASVSGGADSGVAVKVQTVRCRDCRSIFDAVVALRAAEGLKRLPLSATRLGAPPELPPTLAAALNRLAPRPSLRRRWRTYPLACPNDATHRVEPWNAPGRCPRCGEYLEPSALPYRRWD